MRDEHHLPGALEGIAVHVVPVLTLEAAFDAIDAAVVHPLRAAVLPWFPGPVIRDRAGFACEEAEEAAVWCAAERDDRACPGGDNPVPEPDDLRQVCIRAVHVAVFGLVQVDLVVDSCCRARGCFGTFDEAAAYEVGDDEPVLGVGRVQEWRERLVNSRRR
jgi:hypothetical protein